MVLVLVYEEEDKNIPKLPNIPSAIKVFKKVINFPQMSEIYKNS